MSSSYLFLNKINLPSIKSQQLHATVIRAVMSQLAWFRDSGTIQFQEKTENRRAATIFFIGVNGTSIIFVVLTS